MSPKKPTVHAELEKLQRETFGYFMHETNPANGLVVDKTAVDWPASIAADRLHDAIAMGQVGNGPTTSLAIRSWSGAP